ncbi:MAG TPA: Hsp20/alpha crystallin family protein [Candidatus Tectomicrobia bacterium]|nr:Hsp20/alpha crystallin family protein [Candidatus Tectomicrobia bacterium]
MALARWTPYRDIMSVRDEMNRVMNEVFGRGTNDESAWVSGAWSPPVDIFETDEALVMKAELPGFSKDDISIELKDNSLVIKGERKYEDEVKEGNYHRRERAYGPFQRSFMLPTTVDQEKVKASYKDGILELRLPKVQAAQPKRIAVSA